jgi:hypothetical protein
MMGEANDHDLLIRIDERVEKLDRCMTNHLRHHWAVTMLALGAVVSAVLSLLIQLVR